ncbi:MAG: hypothetical protein V1678_00170 [Candidatus Aenigmatarchaeota archaeon]
MAELKQRNDVLAPHYVKVVKYNGENTTKVLKFIPSLIKSTFKVTSTNFYEDFFKWDNVTEVNDFFAAWRGKYSYDNRTSLWVDVKVQGVQNEKTKKGNVTIWIRGYIITKFTYENILMKSLLRLYSYYFYSGQKIKYNEEAKRNLDIFEKEVKTQLGI